MFKPGSLSRVKSCAHSTTMEKQEPPLVIEQQMPSSGGGGGDDCEAGSSSPPPPPPPPRGPPPEDDEEARDWAALPRDVVLEIFGRARQADVLRGAGLACAPWWRAAVEEPALWRRVDVHFGDDEHHLVDGRMYDARLAMACAAVDRGAGRCESYRGPVDRHVLAHIAAAAPSLRSLEATSAWCLPKEFFDRVIPRLPMLERLVLHGGYLLMSTVRGLLEHCPRLEVLEASMCSNDEITDVALVVRCLKQIKTHCYLPCMMLPFCCCLICLEEEREKRLAEATTANQLGNPSQAVCALSCGSTI